MGARGFTLVEMVIVLAIGGILLVMAIPAVQGYIERSRVAQAVADVMDISAKVKQYERSTGTLPATLADADPSLASKADPWGHAYYYLDLTGIHAGSARKDKKLAPLNSDFDLYSAGVDGQTELSLTKPVSRDDVVRARDGGFVGLAADFDPL